MNSIKATALALAVSGITILSGCEGQSMKNWNDLPVSVTGDSPGTMNVEMTRQEAAALKNASDRLPLVTSMSCGPFSVDLRAHSEMRSGMSNISEATKNKGRGEPFQGFFLVVNEPQGFSGRVRFRELLYPDLNAKIFFRRDGSWEDITNPERTYAPHEVADTYTDRYLGHDLSSNQYPFVDGRYITWQSWDRFYRNAKYLDDVPPEGRYRVSFTSDYEMEWEGGSCAFRLPDMGFTYHR